MDERSAFFPGGAAGPPCDAPRLRPEVVRRDRLVQGLLARPFRLVLVAAPAGFGKTTLVLDWLRECPYPSAWIALDEADNDPGCFFSKLARATGDLGARCGIDPEPLRLSDAAAARAPIPTLTAHLLEAWHAFRHDVAIVFDDYHHIALPELHQAVARLLDHLPPAVHLVVLSRVDPPFPLGRLRLSGELVEVRERDLRFNTDETRTFLERALDRSLDPEDARVLETCTEGWIAGLQMAALSLRHQPDIPAFVRTFTGSHLYVVDYLLEEVVGHQTPEMQQFLLRTSILPRFDARLCRAVTDMKEAPLLLAEAERAGLFLASLDDRRAWFRYHHLFAELLSDRLRRLYPEQWETLHARASAWFEAEGDLKAALRHAGEQTACDHLLRLLEYYGEDLLNRSELATLSAYVPRIPEAASRGHPSFLITRAWTHLLTERYADVEPLLASAERAVAETTLPYTGDEKDRFRGLIAAQRAYLLRLQDRYEACVAASEEALASPAAGSVRNRGLLYYNLGRTHLHLGAMHPARAAFDEAYACTLPSRTWYLALASLGYLGAIAVQTEGLRIGRERLEAGLAFAKEERLDGLPACGVLHYQLGRLHFLRDDLDAAEAAFRQAEELGEAGRVHEVLSNALVGRARVCGARGDFAAARELLQAVAVLRQSAHVRLFDTDFECERARLAFREDDRGQLEAWRTAQATTPDAPFTTNRESADLLRVHLYLAEGAFDAAAPLIETLCRTSERLGRSLTHLVAQLGRSLLLAGTGRPDEAIDVLLAVLEKAAADEIVRPFVDSGEALRDLLQGVLEHPVTPAAGDLARRLLGQPPSGAPAATGVLPTFRQPLEAPLTEREQEVLFHLSRRLSYRAIAEALFVSHDTVKTHVRHLYAKLGASNRREALERARQAGFVLADAARAPRHDLPG